MTLVTAPSGSATPSSILAASPDWRTAVTDLITWFTQNDRCFSSGEIAAYLRTYRPDFAFAVTRIGEHVRDMYDNGTMPMYTDAVGNTLYPTQVPRTTTGTARTLDGRSVHSKSPVGVSVFVYAKDGADGFAHDFEVYIPDFDDPTAAKAVDASLVNPWTNAPAPVAPAPSVVTTATGATAHVPAPAVSTLITGSLSRDDVTAYVRPDRRMCVPRAAFEAWVALTGQPLRGGPNGDPVYIMHENHLITITRAPLPGSVEYHLWTGRGRLAFLSDGTSGFVFNPGDKFTVKVTSAALTIDTSAPV